MENVWYYVNWKIMMQKCINDSNTTTSTTKNVWDEVKGNISKYRHSIFGEWIMGNIFNTI